MDISVGDALLNQGPLLGYTVPLKKSLDKLASNARQRQQTVAGANTVIPITYGRDVVGIKIAAVTVLGDDLLILGVLGYGPYHNIETVYLNDAALTGGVSVTGYLGAAGQTPDPSFVAACAAWPTPYTYTDALPSIVYLVCQVPKTVSGFPRFTAKVMGRKCYDPRKDPSEGGIGSHSLADSSTWEWTENPSLILADYCRSTVYGPGWTVNTAALVAAANANDTLVGGEISKTLNITLDRPASHEEWIEVLRAYAGVFVVRDGNEAKFIVDGVTEPSFAFDSSNIVDKTLRVKKRGVRGVPTVVEVVYTDTGKIPYRDSDPVVAEITGAPRRVSRIRLPGINRYSQAARAAVDRLNALYLNDLSATFQAIDTTLKCQVGDTVTVTHPVGLGVKPMRITKIDDLGHGRWDVDVQEYDPAAYSGVVVTAPTYPDTVLPTGGGPVSGGEGGTITIDASQVVSGQFPTVRFGDATVTPAKTALPAISPLSGNLNNNTVGPAQIVVNAVSVAAGANASSSFTVTTSWQVALSVTIDFGSVTPHAVHITATVSFQESGVDKTSVQAGIRRAGSILQSAGVSADVGYTTNIPLSVVDSPGSGSHTYELIVKEDVVWSGADVSAVNRNITAVGYFR